MLDFKPHKDIFPKEEMLLFMALSVSSDHVMDNELQILNGWMNTNGHKNNLLQCKNAQY